MKLSSNNLGPLLSDITRMMRRAFQENYRPTAECSLTLTQARALLSVARNEGLKQIELAELLEIKPITAARLVDVLCDASLVERRQDAKDRRAFQLFLTEAAFPHITEIERAAVQVYSKAFQGFKQEEQDELLNLLTQVRQNLA
ncbi:MarR family transcriptional regulator [Shewanella sp. A25]|nr:MarR family transcriptional regulator [Shewanella shenzhenensis]